MHIDVTVTDVDLASVINPGDDYSRSRTLADAVVAKVVADFHRTEDGRDLARRVAAIRDEEIRAVIRPIILDAVAAPVQQTNGFGEVTGQTTTLTMLIMQQVQTALGERSDYGRGPTDLQKLVATEVDKAIRAELAETIKEEKAKVVAAVRAKAADLIATAVREGVGR